jgi:hypothetical protein
MGARFAHKPGSFFAFLALATIAVGIVLFVAADRDASAGAELDLVRSAR